MSQAGADTRIGFRVGRAMVLFIYGFAIVCTVILAMAFFLELFNANEGTPFVQWVFRATDRIMQPFRGIFPRSRARAARSSIRRCSSRCSCTGCSRSGCMRWSVGSTGRSRLRGTRSERIWRLRRRPHRWSRGQRTQVLPADRAQKRGARHWRAPPVDRRALVPRPLSRRGSSCVPPRTLRSSRRPSSRAGTRGSRRSP